MKPNELTACLTRLAKAQEPAMIIGSPGIGKTDICRQVAENCEMDFIPVIPAISDPTDPKGVPGRNGEGDWEWHLIGDARRIAKAKKPTFVLLDDLGQAAPSVQAAYMQWPLLRRIGEHAIPDCVSIFACSNRKQDRAGVNGILEPVKSRFITIYELTVDEMDWVEWAFTHNMPSKLIAFVHFRPTLLTSFKPSADITNSPSPRTFANAGRLINLGLDDIESLSGAVGEGCAVEMAGFFKYWNQLPNLDALIADPDKADVPDEPAALYAVVTGLVEKAMASNIGRIFKYAKRLPKDFSILLGRDCIRKDKDKKIQNTKEFIKWACDNKDVLMA